MLMYHLYIAVACNATKSVLASMKYWKKTRDFTLPVSTRDSYQEITLATSGEDLQQ